MLQRLGSPPNLGSSIARHFSYQNHPTSLCANMQKVPGELPRTPLLGTWVNKAYRLVAYLTSSRMRPSPGAGDVGRSRPYPHRPAHNRRAPLPSGFRQVVVGLAEGMSKFMHQALVVAKGTLDHPDQLPARGGRSGAPGGVTHIGAL